MNHKMNILITSIGQRGYLIDHFRKSASSSFGIYAADATPFAPAAQLADKAFVLPMASHPKYRDCLLDICLSNDIVGILSINDQELTILAANRNLFESYGIQIIVSTPNVIDICFDKYKTYQFCIKHQINVPETFLWSQYNELLSAIESGLISLPIIAKPRKGSRSIGIRTINTKQQLEITIREMEVSPLPEDEKLIFQEFIDSDQFSIHVFNNESLHPCRVVTMVNIIKHLGETFHIETYRDKSLSLLGKRIGECLGHLGPLSADVHQRNNGEYVVLEFNPRISGCYSLSHYSGADFPGLILKLIKRESIPVDNYDIFEEDVVMLKMFTTMKTSRKDILSHIANQEYFEV